MVENLTSKSASELKELFNAGKISATEIATASI